MSTTALTGAERKLHGGALLRPERARRALDNIWGCQAMVRTTMTEREQAVIDAARILGAAMGIGMADHLVGVRTYRDFPATTPYEQGHQDAMIMFADEKIAAWMPLYEALRLALEALERT